jgi:hypothetical protein
MTCALFDLWGDDVFFPAIEERRRKFGYTGKIVLLMDGLGAHHTGRFAGKCAREGIEPVFLVPHSSDQCQPLDLVTFGLLKQAFSRSRFNSLENPQSNRIVRMLGAFYAASAPHQNISAFRAVGLCPYERGGGVYLRVVRGMARGVRSLTGFRQGTRVGEGPDGPGSAAKRRVPLRRG